jgi:hypothetical protein
VYLAEKKYLPPLKLHLPNSWLKYNGLISVHSYALL